MTDNLLHDTLKAHKIGYQYAVPFSLPQAQGVGYYLYGIEADLLGASYKEWQALSESLQTLGFAPVVIEADLDVCGIIETHSEALHACAPQHLERCLANLPTHIVFDAEDENETLDLNNINETMTALFDQMQRLGHYNEHQIEMIRKQMELTDTLAKKLMQHDPYDVEMDITQQFDECDDDTEPSTLSELITHNLFPGLNNITEAVEDDILPTSQLAELMQIVMAQPLTLAAITALYDQYIKENIPDTGLDLDEDQLLADLEMNIPVTEYYCDSLEIKECIAQKVCIKDIKSEFSLDRALFECELSHAKGVIPNSETVEATLAWEREQVQHFNTDALTLVLVPIQNKEEADAKIILNLQSSLAYEYPNLAAAMWVRYVCAVHGAHLLGLPNGSGFFLLKFEPPIQDLNEVYELTVLAEKIFSLENMVNGTPCRELARARQQLSEWVVGSSYH